MSSEKKDLELQFWKKNKTMNEGKTRNNLYFNQLDGLRSLAVLSVMVCHWITLKAVILIPLGSMGVNLFFVLSGFLITRILLIDKDTNGTRSILIPIKKFYIRRTLRIFPVYYLVCLILLSINFHASRENAWWLLSYLFNIKFALPGVWESGQLSYMVHLWSLSVEEQFYLIFPILIFLIPKKNIKAFLILTIIIGVASRLGIYLLSWPKNSIYVLTPACFDALGIGALLAYYFMFEKNRLQSILNKNYILYFVFFLFVSSIIYSRNFIKGYGECRTITERFLFSICCFWIVGKAVMNEYRGGVKLFLENKIVLFIGKISYGLYIYHYFAEPFYDFLNIKPLLNIISNKYFYHFVKVSLYFIMTLTISTLSYYIIEKPINNFKSKFK